MRFCVRLCIRKGPPGLPNLDYVKNFPRRYIEDSKETVKKRYWQNRLGAPDMTRWKTHPDDYFVTTDRPFTREADYEKREHDGHVNDPNNAWLRERMKNPQMDIMQNEPKEPPLIAHRYPHRSERQVLKRIPDDQWVFFPGDKVEIMVGRDKGKHGIICYISRDRNWVYVRGRNLEYEESTLGSVIAVEAALDVKRGDVKLVDPASNQACDAMFKEVNGIMQRINTATGNQIAYSNLTRSTYEYNDPAKYAESDKDTPSEVVLKRSVKWPMPLKLFEDEIMEELGIKEKRKYGKTYWY